MVMAIALAIGIVLVVVLLLILLTRIFIFKPLMQLGEAAEQVARGEMMVNFPARRFGKIGRIYDSLAKISDNINILSENFAKTEDAIKHGKLSYRLEDSRLGGVYGEILNKTNHIIHEFDLCFDLLTEPVILTDTNLNVMYANNTIKKFTRKEKQDVIGFHIDELLNDCLSSHPAVSSALKENKPQLEVWIQLQLNQEQLFDLELNCIPFGSDNQIFGLILLITNMSHIGEMQRRAQKVSAYTHERIEFLKSNITDAFGRGHLSIEAPSHEYDEDTKEVAQELDIVENAVIESVGIIKDYVSEINHALRKIAENDFNFNLNLEYKGDFSQISNSINMIEQYVTKLVDEMQGVSNQVMAGADIMNVKTHEFMESFKGQTAIMSAVTEAADSLMEKANKNARGAKEANELSLKVQVIAATGSKHMQEMSDAMKEIIDTSKEISRVVGIIETIAFQTNLLALNASVEAARAGEHGRGFSVVAEEVRNLAMRSDEAAKNTSEILEKSLERVDFGAAKTVQTSGALRSIVEASAYVADAVVHIVKASDEQVYEVGKIRSSVEEVYRSVEGDIAMAIGNAQISEELATQAHSLDDLVAQFKIKTKKGK